jgi:hypothetical protein
MFKARFFVALALGGAVMVAVFGSAASLTNTVSKLGADSATVATCDNAVSTGWDAAYDASTGEFIVTDVTIANIDDSACEDATLKVQLSKGDNTALGNTQTDTVVASTTSYTLDFSAQKIKASEIEIVHVVLVGP